MKTTTFALLLALLQTGASFDASQRMLMLAYECRTAVVAAFGAVQSLFASPENVVAEPAKRGLFALFGR